MIVVTLLAGILSLPAPRPPQDSATIQPFTIYIFTAPRGTAAAAERMHAAVDDAVEITELSDWIELVEHRDEADIVVEVKAYAITEDESHHRIFTNVDVLGKEMLIVGVDERRHAERMRAVSHFMEKLQDYCAENYVLLDSKRRPST